MVQKLDAGRRRGVGGRIEEKDGEIRGDMDEEEEREEESGRGEEELVATKVDSGEEEREEDDETGEEDAHVNC